jgi:hypothetical protein
VRHAAAFAFALGFNEEISMTEVQSYRWAARTGLAVEFKAFKIDP